MASNSGNNGKQNLSVVVWEWENKQGRWRPYSPEVTQHLERAYGKNLKSVMLGDADPSLSNYSVNLSTMLQIGKDSSFTVKIRRKLYPQSSPAGQGAVWQWAGDNPGDWHIYDMNVQCVLEEAWATGTQTIDMTTIFPTCPYVINFCNLIQTKKGSGYSRCIRRKTQASYPIGRPVTPQQNSLSLSQTNTGPSTSTSSSSGRSGASHESKADSERGRRRESKEERELEARHKSESHARHIFNKVLNLAGSSSCGGGDGGGHSKGSAINAPSTSKSAKHDPVPNGVPHPMPRSVVVPPVPKPRTLFPSGQPPPRPPPANHDNRYYQSVDMADEQYGSNVTLNSDCSSFTSARRPSIETISTYLSQDSFNEEMGAHGTSHSLPDRSSSGPKMDNLIHLDDSMSEDEVFEDKEVRDVMMKSNHGNEDLCLPPSLALGRMNPSQPESHFVPISSPVESDTSTLNGVKRKRTTDQARHSFNPMNPMNSTQPINPMNPPTIPTNPMTSMNPPTNPMNPPTNPMNPGQQPSYSRMETRSSRAKTDYRESTDFSSSCTLVDHSINNNNNNNNYRKVVIRKPKTAADKLLVQHTKALHHPSNEDCSICLCPLNEDIGSENPNSPGYLVSPAVSLSLCSHNFHEECVARLIANTPSDFLQCPNCKRLHGERWGNQPTGDMKVTRIKRSLPGHSGSGTIQITYSIPPGIQGPEHPFPGQRYTPIGFPRVAYLPESDKGKRALKLLREAFRRRLIFTVGVSVTTGMRNVVTWNEIHHKTEWFNNSGHGYPDPLYLDSLIAELKSVGVTE